MESKASSKSTKFKYRLACHSFVCSTMFLKTKICSAVPLPFPNPNCSFLRLLSTPLVILSMMILPRISHTIGSRVMPLQFLHSSRFPFFGNLMTRPFFQILGMVFLTQMLLNKLIVNDLSSKVNIGFQELSSDRVDTR